ncbi:MAG: glycoside hydrolase family 3 N-terminal domain-containing protein [Thermodesulfovibrionales bacterium]|nr:glycoside hydrolase family 3 N-terminal domain-containing protein [Thermodesulfovibrionales bacterium]
MHDTNMSTAPGTVRRKIYQLVIGRLDGDNIGDPSYEEKIRAFVQKGIGGFIIFGGTREAVRSFLLTLRPGADIPLFIAADIERGLGQQIRGTTLFPSQMAMAAAFDIRNPEGEILFDRAVKEIARESKTVGINMPLIPVLDVNQNPDNPIICTRAFSDNPETVALFGSCAIKILEREGLFSCAKHFPGHGDTAVDSHISLPEIRKSPEEFMAVDLLPFQHAVSADVSSIMIGHLSAPVFDDRPASLSRTVVTGLLRGKLGFEGLIMTDALNMHALKGYGDVPVQCLNAGVDILLHPPDPDLTVGEVVRAIEAGDISERQIDNAVSRILRHKKRIKEHAEPDVEYSGNEEFATRIFEMSITLVKDTPGVLPLSQKDKVSVLFCGDASFFPESPLRNFCGKASVLSRTDELQGHVHNEVAVFAIFTSVAAWKGSSGISEEELSLIRKLSAQARHSVVLSFGSPYVLRHFKEADILIAAYDVSAQAQHAVIRCLEGRRGFQGRLPIRLIFGQ